MIVVGLTGGIASGKSLSVKYLKKLKIPTHDSDNTINRSNFFRMNIEVVNFVYD